MNPRQLTGLDPDYPSRLRGTTHAPASLTVRGGSLEAACCVAVIGSREADAGAVRFARALAGALADAGAVVVSGGARGIDAAAHRGALARRGRTWVVAGTAPECCYPKEHAGLFETIGRGPGAVLWPFPSGYRARSSFLVRNRILVTLADAIVVVQAAMPSGALHAAQWARTLNRPIWVVPPPPWEGEPRGRPEARSHGRDRPRATGEAGARRRATAPRSDEEAADEEATAVPPRDSGDRFAGSRALLALGARPLLSIGRLLGDLELGPLLDPPRLTVRRRRAPALGTDGSPRPRAGPLSWAMPRPCDRSAASLALSTNEIAILAVLSNAPLHHEAIAIQARQSVQAASAALLTLALEDVVVEGPPGFFRRRTAAGTG